MMTDAFCCSDLGSAIDAVTAERFGSCTISIKEVTEVSCAF